MSITTNAVVFYGYCWLDETSALDWLTAPRYDGEWQVYLLEQRGIVSPWETFPDDINRLPYAERRRQTDAWATAHRDALDSWHAQRSAIEQEMGCDIGWHCSDSVRMPYLYAVESHHYAWGGDPVELFPATFLAPTAMMEARLAQFCAALSLTPPQPSPAWFLASYWG